MEIRHHEEESVEIITNTFRAIWTTSIKMFRYIDNLYVKCLKP